MRLTTALILFAALCLPGCSTYLAGYDYVPRPVDVELVKGSRVLAAVPGLRRSGESGGNEIKGPALEIQLQVDHDGPGLLVLGPDGLEVTGGNLVRLEDAITDPPAGLVLQSGESGRLVAYFVLPGRDGGPTADMDGLNLRMTAQIDGQTVTRSVSFTEREQQPNGGRVKVGVGVGVGL